MNIKNNLFCIIIVILLLILTGCINSESNLLVGEWENIDKNDDSIHPILIFTSDGKYKLDYINSWYIGIEDIEINYELLENNVIRIFNDTMSNYLNYEFIDDNTLQLSENGSSDFEIYKRI